MYMRAEVTYLIITFITGYAYKQCTENGEWWSHTNQTESFSHYHMCNDQQEIAVSFFN